MVDESTLGKQPDDSEATSIVSAFADQSLAAVAKQQAAERQRSLTEGAEAANRVPDGPDWEPGDPPDSLDRESGRIPPGLLVAAVAAILLLGFGGYGVVKERSELREEITRLQAELAAPAATDGGTTETRQALRRIERRNDELRATIAKLEQENQRLQAALAEQQTTAVDSINTSPASLEAGEPDSTPTEAVLREESAGPEDTTPGAAATVAAAPPPSRSGGENGAWFVNFSSYSQRANAQDWADRLTPDSGRVTVVPGVSNNKTYYRVRVVDLESRAQASQVARQLEREHKLSGLWVGSNE